MTFDGWGFRSAAPEVEGFREFYRDAGAQLLGGSASAGFGL